MNKLSFILLAAAMLFAAQKPQTFTGTITDSMCVANHAMMRITPESKCVTECVKSNATVKYALYDGKTVYKLSDQETPAKFAAQKVKVTGTLFPKTGVIKVEKIEAAK